MEHSSDHDCHHSSIEITYPEDECVCTQCGMVTDKNYFDTCNIVIDELEDCEIRNRLTNIMINIHIPLGILDLTMFTYRQFRCDERLSKFKNIIIAIFALYDILNTEGITRSEHELCYVADIDPHKLWCIQKILGYESRATSSSFIERMSVELNFPFFLQNDELDLVDRIKETSYSKPGTVIACSFYKVIQDRQLEIEITKICQAASVSKTSVINLYKQIQNIV
jgi:hypothetical protein